MLAGYTPEEAPTSQNVGDITAWVHRELSRISGALQTDTIVLNLLTVEPEKPTEGLVVNADGTSWNPGHGKGLYVYLDGHWKKATN